MKKFVLAVVVVVSAVATLVYSKVLSVKKAEAQVEPVDAETFGRKSQKSIEKLLADLEAAPKLQERRNAMCYKVAPPPEFDSYICLIDGQKTEYKRYLGDIFIDGEKTEYRQYLSDNFWVISEIEYLRLKLQELNEVVTEGVNFKFDETRLCAICSPNLNAYERYIILIASYPDGTEVKNRLLNDDDLASLISFFIERRSGIESQSTKNRFGIIKKYLGKEL